MHIPSMPGAPGVIMKGTCPYCKYPYVGTYIGCYQSCSCKKLVHDNPKPPIGPKNLDINDFSDTPVQPPPTTQYVNVGKKQDNTWSWYSCGIGFCAGTLVWAFMLILSKIGG